jgi:hypothetical protein
MIANTSPKGRAYGIHGPHEPGLIQELIEEATISGIDVTYNEAVDEIKSKVKDLLDDSDGIEEFTGDANYSVGEDSITDGLFLDFIAEALKCADVISFQDKRPTEGTDADLLLAVLEQYDSEEGWDWTGVHDVVLEYVNDQGWLYDGEPHTYTHIQSVKLADGTEHDVKMMVSPIGGAQQLWVLDSPYITPCTGCSPCCPGAGDLDAPSTFFDPRDERPGRYDPANGKYAHCLPPEWFKDAGDPVPYEEVYHHQAAYDSVSRRDFLSRVYPDDGGVTKLYFGEAYLP